MYITLKKVFSMVLLVGLLMQAPTAAYASWGLQKLLQENNQQSTADPSVPKTTTEQPQPSHDTQVSSPPKNQTTADLIRSLRGNSLGQTNNTSNITGSNTNPITPAQPAPQPDSNYAGLTSQENLMLELINNERKERGLKPLILHTELVRLARLKSQDMVNNNYFAHTSPTYGSFYQMVYNAGIPFRQVGENLAKARDVNKAHILLMASEGHKKNILSPTFTHLGIGISSDRYGIVVTQLYIAER
ncbi:CAP domain-containing protein [Desulfitibacter alkalitolerans]|uniref:CAP domain-containing protein n=1 Tax=Desulfitibacter alkalitolerans TaxID=264641 RepID=UPI000685B4C5|nr:CAP domain-containing protein [Desulfitibacter alkalitolerans]